MTSIQRASTTGVDDMAASFGRSLRARNRSPKTIKAYLETAGLFVAFQLAAGAPTEPADVRRFHVEAFITDQLRQWSASTAATRFRCLQQFFKFCAEEGEIEVNPMASMSPPTIGEVPVPVFTPDELSRLLRGCEGKGFDNRRDHAIVSTFIDTGCRLAEMAGLTVDDINLDQNAAYVTGKGNRGRWLNFGDKAAISLDRYMRERRRHARSQLDALWLGPKGGLTDSGITQLLRRRAAAVEVAGMHAHRFRHTFAHQWLAAGGSEGDLQELAGWRSPQMLARYGASARSERARDSHRRLSPLDRL